MNVEETNLFSDSFPSMINPIVRIMLHIRSRDQNLEFAREDDILLVRLPLSYLPRHLAEMSGVSPHPMNEDLSPT